MKVKIFILAALIGFCPPTFFAQTHRSPVRRTTTVSRASAGSLLRPGSLNAQAPEVYRVKFLTSKGEFVVEVMRAWAPLGADRFYNLVKNGFYTNCSFFRVLPGFVTQFGINAKPTIAEAWAQAKIKDDPVSQSNLRGTLTFATGGPDTRTTQVFINLVDNMRLDQMGFAPFGKVIKGMDVVEKFYSGYGEGAPQGNGPDQGRITNEGKPYLDKYFPKLDSIKQAVLETVPAAKPAA
ncbi:MAG: peptidylprolyl isomerase, partial [Deltaproteobacteria bacterium]